MRTYEYRMDVFIRNVIKRVPSPCTLTLSLKRKEDFFSEFWLLCCVSANQVFQNQFCVPMVVVGWCCSVSYAQQNNNFHLRQPTKSLVRTCLSTQCKREREENDMRDNICSGKTSREREREKRHTKNRSWTFCLCRTQSKRVVLLMMTTCVLCCVRFVVHSIYQK